MSNGKPDFARLKKQRPPGQGDGRDWARWLKARHEAGEQLTIAQVEMYRRALRMEPYRP